jgi:hypothetical protein
MTASDQAPSSPPPPSASQAQAPQAPSAKPCTGGLFRSVTDQQIAPSPDSATVRERAVTFNVDQVKAMPATLTLNLFDDLCVVAMRQQNVEAAPVPVWMGTVEGVLDSQVTIIFNPGAAAGNIVMPPKAFQLELVSGEVYRVREVDVTKYANELPPMTPPPAAPPTKAPPKKKQP